jgi:hypothetical protein
VRKRKEGWRGKTELWAKERKEGRKKLRKRREKEMIELNSVVEVKE